MDKIIQILIKPKKNLKGINLNLIDKIMQRKRTIIECTNEVLNYITNL